jgi:hypothetical protein
MKDSVLIYIVEDSLPSALLYQSYLDSLGYKVLFSGQNIFPA